MTELAVLYRTHPGRNGKVRPAWFDRGVALASLLASLEEAGAGDAPVTVLADGGLPPEVAARLRPQDEVVGIRGGTAAASFRRCVDVAVSRARTDRAGTLYWFAEDDYLYRPEAVGALLAAARHFAAPGAGGDASGARADYLTLYTSDDSAWYASHPSQPERRVPPLPGGPHRPGGVAWRRVAATTSTFGVTREALLADAWLLRAGTRAGAPFDAATWHALQGFAPYDWRHLLHDLDGYLSPRGVGKVVGKPPLRAALNLATAARRGPRRVLVAPATDLAMHLEVAALDAAARGPATRSTATPGRAAVLPGDGWDDLAAGLAARAAEREGRYARA